MSTEEKWYQKIIESDTLNTYNQFKHDLRSNSLVRILKRYWLSYILITGAFFVFFSGTDRIMNNRFDIFTLIFTIGGIFFIILFVKEAYNLIIFFNARDSLVRKIMKSTEDVSDSPLLIMYAKKLHTDPNYQELLALHAEKYELKAEK